MFFKDISRSRAFSESKVVSCCSPVNSTLHRHDIIRVGESVTCVSSESPFYWLRGGKTMKIELFSKLDCESFIFCEQIRGKIKNSIFTKPLKGTVPA